MSDTVTITLDPVEKEALRHEASEPYGRAVRAALLFKLRTALDPPTPEQPRVSSGLSDEDRRMLHYCARAIDGEHYGFAESLRELADRKLAEHSSSGEGSLSKEAFDWAAANIPRDPSSGEAGLREHLNATFNRWADRKYANSVDLNGYDKAKERATAAAFRNAADYVLDAELEAEK
jgi:hypothetical protein